MKDHQHNWQLADYEKGKTLYRGMAVGMSVMEVPVGRKPDVAKYVCDCGEKKQVEVKDD